MVNTIVKIYPKVSQFWTYDPKGFLAQPVYSRDYPPLRAEGGGQGAPAATYPG